MPTKKAVALKEENAMMVKPDFLANREGPARGSEEVGSDDVTVPRIELVQSLSSCRDEDDPSYIEGIKEGNMYNNVTREIYENDLAIIPVAFRKEYLIWRDQQKGGGFRGAFPNMNEAREAFNELDDKDECEIVDTSQHYVLIVRADGRLDQAVLSMAKSKRKISRDWNALMRLEGGDTFAVVYGLSGVKDENKDGQKFYNYKITGKKRYVSLDEFKAAEAMYEAVMGGELKADTTFDNDIEGEVAESEEF